MTPIVLSKPRTKRSPKWTALSKRFLKGKKCAVCGRKDDLVSHHKKPYHLFPELELEESNLIPMCEGKVINCHFAVGHLFSFMSYNPTAEVDAARIVNKVASRP